MAEFCKSCSQDIWGFDTKDLAGLVTGEKFEQGSVAVVLCEGCSAQYVAPNGERVKESEDGLTWEKY